MSFTKNPVNPMIKNPIPVALAIIANSMFQGDDKYLNGNKHIFFSHSFQNQQKSSLILKSFYKTNSIIYDFEYFLTFSTSCFISLISCV